MQGVHTLPLFVDATDEELAWLIENSTEVLLEQGEFFFREGEPASQFYVVLDGELQVFRTLAGERTVLGTTPRGIMGGETFLLSGGTALASAQAIMPSRLMVFDLPAFLQIFTKCPSFGINILQTAAERTQGVATRVTQVEKLSALGKLSAGLAHELNNPAAAARRSANMLQEMLHAYQASTLRLGTLGMTEEQLEELIAFMEDVRKRRHIHPPLTALEKSDREDQFCDWFEDRGVEEYWDLASSCVDWHLSTDELETVLSWVPASRSEELLTWMHDSLTTSELLAEIEECTVRISDLVGAVKSYTYMDRGAYQEVDIHEGLDNTLMVLKNRLQNVTVDRRYDPQLPRLVARGSALNQVWTNLIENAVDAMGGDGVLTLITRGENSYVMVEVKDSGPGIPPEDQPRLFEPFFTTKEVGSGTGLGLDITYRIVQDHKGTIELRSEPGNTRFIVRLPLRSLEEAEQTEGAEASEK